MSGHALVSSPLLRVAAAVVVATLVLVPGSAGGVDAPAPLPVPYDFLVSAIASGANFTGNPPGANDFSCKPSAAHPEPVVMTHGILGDRVTNWQTYAPLLKNNGYCVFAITYGQSPLLPAPLNQALGGLTTIEDSALQLKAFVAQVLAATGANKVDILEPAPRAPSCPTTTPSSSAARGTSTSTSRSRRSGTRPAVADSPRSRRSVRWRSRPARPGTELTNLVAPALGEMIGGSPFFTKLQSGGTTKVPGITYTNITTKYDELVTPYTSGFETGETNLVVQNYCTTDYTEHFEIVADPVAAALVLNALDPAHPRAVPCTLVLPFIGTGI